MKLTGGRVFVYDEPAVGRHRPSSYFYRKTGLLGSALNGMESQYNNRQQPLRHV